MAITITSPIHSFVQFNQAAQQPYCIWGPVDYCLPVFVDTDVNFQFIVQGDTSDEIDQLCTTDASEVEVSIVPDCNETPLLIFAEKPDRIRLSETRLLYNWDHGFPGFNTVVNVKQCFKAQVRIIGIYSDTLGCSNCFERIRDDCFTSVLEYGNDEDSFGFYYCTSGSTEGDLVESCEPTIVQFISQSTLSIPYTAFLSDKYGPVPNVQVWIYNDVGELVNMGITVGFDGYPVALITMDFGGVSSGIVTIR